MTYQKLWTIGRSGERGSGISVLVARHDDHDALRSHFYVPRGWLKNNQSRAAVSTSAVQPHVCAFFKLTSFFTFDTNDVTRDLDCRRNRLQLHVALHTRKVIPWETLCTWGSKILLLQAFEFVRTSHEHNMELKELIPRRMLELNLRKTPLFAIILLFFFFFIFL